MSFKAAYDNFCNRLYRIARKKIYPSLRNSQYVYREALAETLVGEGRWLDVGCGHQFLPDWMDVSDRRLDLGRWQTAGIDPDLQSLRRHDALALRVCGGAEHLPFNDGAFTLVTANMVLEHIATPGRFFEEVARILAPGGTLLVHTPNARGYTTWLTRFIPAAFIKPLARMLLDRKADDVYPTHYRANTLPVLTELARPHQLVPCRMELVDSSPQLIRIPPLMAIEVILMRAVQSNREATTRPCILAIFKKKQNGPTAR